MIHTLFSNKTDFITDEDLDVFKKQTIERLTKTNLYKCTSYEDWAFIINKWIESCDDFTQLKIYYPMGTKLYYETNRKILLNDLKILESKVSSKDVTISAIQRHGFCPLYDENYDLDDFGWHDNFLMNEYNCNCNKFSNANVLLSYLEDNEEKIDGGKLTDEISSTIISFFNKYPYGSIEFFGE